MFGRKKRRLPPPSETSKESLPLSPIVQDEREKLVTEVNKLRIALDAEKRKRTVETQKRVAAEKSLEGLSVVQNELISALERAEKAEGNLSDLYAQCGLFWESVPVYVKNRYFDFWQSLSPPPDALRKGDLAEQPTHNFFAKKEG